MRGDEDSATTLGLLQQPLRERRLPVRVDSAGGLVEDEQVGLGDGDRRDPEPFALAAREITGMAARGEREAEPLERGRGTDRDLR